MERQWGQKPRDLPEGQVQRTFPGHARYRTRRTAAELVRRRTQPHSARAAPYTGPSSVCCWLFLLQQRRARAAGRECGGARCARRRAHCPLSARSGTPRLAALLPCTCPQGRIAAAAAAASAAVRLLLLLLLLLLRLPPPGGRVGILKLALCTECAVPSLVVLPPDAPPGLRTARPRGPPKRPKWVTSCATSPR